MRKIIFYFFIVCLFISCKDSQVSQKVSFDMDSEQQTLFDLNVISDYDVVKLETTDESIISKLDKVIVADNNIFIMDGLNNQSVYVFDMTGKFKFKIYHLGRGKNEYLQLFDMFYDEHDKTINLLSRLPSKIMKYSSDADSLLEQIPFERDFSRIESNGENYVCHQGNYSQGGDNYNVCTLSLDGKIIDKWNDIPAASESTFSYNAFPLSLGTDDNVLYFDINTRKLYSVKGPKHEEEFSVNFGKYNYTTKAAYDKMSFIEQSMIISDIRYFTETENYYIFNVLFNGQNVFCVLDKDTNKTYIASASSNNSKYMLSFGKIASIQKNLLITYVDAESIIQQLDYYNQDEEIKREYGKQVSNLKKRVGTMSSDDNPLLVIYTLK